MKGLKNGLLALAVLFGMAALNAQSIISGTVHDAQDRQPLPGANVSVKGSSQGTSTDFDGNFTLKTNLEKGTLIISFVGYERKEVPFVVSNGKASVKVWLNPDAQSLGEVVVTGSNLLDVAKERQTPVAVSTIKAADIIEKLGNQEFPEILNTTPSVYATKSGGGFGDSRINIRGFEQENIAVTVNGVPVNDMETGRVYWSNWSGISDVTSAMQVQRGLGASKLAIASVGGTINIITRSADMPQGGRAMLSLANDGGFKTLAAYNTGVSPKGWSASVLLSRDAGEKYADATQYEGYNYFLGIGYRASEKHDFQFIMTGAPQWHNQRTSSVKITDAIKYGSNGKPNRRYNSDWGYLNGEAYSNRVNYYHKPVLSLNWDWKMNPSSQLSSVVYASFGRGGGTADLGRVGGKGLRNFKRTSEGLIDFDAIYQANAAAPAGEGIISRASINSHNWLGLLSSFNHKINEQWEFSVGVDGRYYKGYHYRIVTDLLGAKGYSDNTNKNLTAPNLVTNTFKAKPNFNPFGGKINDISDRIGYSNDGEVKWLGTFGQVEYATEVFSAFLQGSLSQQSYQRIDNFLKDGTPYSRTNPTPLHTKTGFKDLLGYNVKGGANYNINEYHNVFANIGYYEKQPFFNAVYPNNRNFVNPYLTNEKIFGLEFGYGLKINRLSANVNLYRTSWKDRNVRGSVVDPSTGQRIGYSDILGVEEIHQGFEVDMRYSPCDQITLRGMLSLGDWYYKNNARGTVYDDNTNEPVPGQEDMTLYLNDVKVGNSAQKTASLGADWKPVQDLKISATYRYVGDLYSSFQVDKMSSPNAKGAIELPDYGLVDFGVSYKFRLKDKQYFTLSGNIYNIFDTYYISDSYTNIHLKTASDFTTAAKYQDYLQNNTYKGIDTSNLVYFGSGITYNVSLSFNF